jgi:hypothetical protein
MGQFIRVNGDYNIKAIDGGTIKLDTGPNVGQVLITGDLLVRGDTTTVQAVNLDITDNIIELNKGETGDGVTLIYSGIKIDRGTQPHASIVFNENPLGVDYWQIASALSDGIYNFQNSRLKVNEILTEPVVDVNPNGNLNLIGTSSPNGVITVSGTNNYELQVTDDDDIPNKRYVDDAIFNNPTFQIRSDDTRVVISEKENPESLEYYTDQTGLDTDGESAVSFLIDGTLVAEYRQDRLFLQSLKFEDNTIAIDVSLSLADENIKFITNGTSGKVQFDNAIQLDQRTGPFSIVPGSVLLHAGVPGLGTTGLYYVNDSNESRKQSGELINKNKALLFSILF